MQQQFPAVLRLLRLRSGLTGRQFAPKLGKCNSWVSKIESGTISITAVDFFSWLSASGNTISTAIKTMQEEGIQISKFAVSRDLQEKQYAGMIMEERDLLEQLQLLAQLCEKQHIGLRIRPNGEYQIQHKSETGIKIRPKA